LFTCKTQFGYHIDTWYHCKYLSSSDVVSTICFDYGKEKRSLQNVTTHYVSRSGSSFSRMFRFILEVFNIVKKGNFDIVFIKYFSGCSILRILCPRVNFIFDIRTADVSGNYYKRSFKDYLMKFESLLFSNITIISESLRKDLGYSENSYILPLGAELRLISRCNYIRPHLLYVGTLTGRSLEKVIYGLRRFIDNNDILNITFTIVGEGWGNERNELEELCVELGLSDIVDFKGFVHHSDMQEILSKCNIGVSFVPMTPFFDKQPVTKTFEYLLSGMPVIATSTFEHKRIIKPDNGVLIIDTADDFSRGLEVLHNKLKSADIRISPDFCEQHSWKRIVSDLRTFFLSII
jgi:glycosyltransferase involved in cell wall biosynthesis